jgi:ribose/xylose/arabinose/galactoside ABC-type transport system permease subunit
MMKKVLSLLNKGGIVLAVIVLFALLSLVAPHSFHSLANLETMARQMTIVGFAALGMTLVIIMGGIDLSAGSIIALSTVVIALLLEMGVSPALAAIGGITAGFVAGLLNGFLIARLKITPFIVTLGTLLIIRGLAKGMAHEQKIDAPLCWLADLAAALSDENKYLIFPAGVWLLVGCAFIFTIFLKYTVPGRHIFAIGSNELTARLCGVRIEKIKTIAYAICGATAGLAGVMQFSRLTVGDPTVAAGLELDIIAAVVIGGGSLAGGEGSILGSLCGAAMMTMIRSAASQMALPNWIQEIVTGFIIVIAVIFDRLRHSKERKD